MANSRPNQLLSLLRIELIIRRVHPPDCILLFPAGQVQKENPVKPFGPAQLRWQLADVVGRANHKHVGLVVIEICQQRPEHASRNTAIRVRQLAIVGGNPRGDVVQLFPRRQRVFKHYKLFFKFGGDLHDRRQDDDERPVLFALADLLGEGLDEFGRLQEPVEVRQDQQRGAVPRRQRTERTNGRQRILASTVVRSCAARQRQTPLDIPHSQPPVLVFAQFGNFGNCIVVFVRLDPKASETGLDIFG